MHTHINRNGRKIYWIIDMVSPFCDTLPRVIICPPRLMGIRMFKHIYALYIKCDSISKPIRLALEECKNAAVDTVRPRPCLSSKAYLQCTLPSQSDYHLSVIWTLPAPFPSHREIRVPHKVWVQRTRRNPVQVPKLNSRIALAITPRVPWAGELCPGARIVSIGAKECESACKLAPTNEYGRDSLICVRRQLAAGTNLCS